MSTLVFSHVIFTFFLYAPSFFLIGVLFLSKHNLIMLKKASLIIANIYFFCSVLLTGFYNMSLYSGDGLWFKFQIYSKFAYFLNLLYVFGLDGISLLLINLTTFLIPLCILVNIVTINYRFKEYIFLLFLLELLLINTFSALNIFYFYIFFESVLIPMFIIIGIWGSRQRKVHAAYQFFIYTFFGSIFMLVAISLIYLHLGTTSYELLLFSNFNLTYQKFLWLSIFFSLAIKVPMIPLHIWLPEAHVEAPTAGSVLLAGILLKLGSYGMLRFLIPVFILGTYFYLPLIYTFCILAIVYGSLTTLHQVDLKKIIAYSSVVHMNFGLLGLFAFNIEGIQGSIYLMLGHGVVSSALFLCIGCLYDRYHTRILKYYGGLVVTMPLFSLFFLIFTLANIAFPGTCNFVGEFLIFLGIFQQNITIGFLSAFGVILSACYSIWLYNRIIFKDIKIMYLFKFRDLKKSERFLFYPLLFLVFFMGIYPKFFLDLTYGAVLNILLLK